MHLYDLISDILYIMFLQFKWGVFKPQVGTHLLVTQWDKFAVNNTKTSINHYTEWFRYFGFTVKGHLCTDKANENHLTKRMCIFEPIFPFKNYFAVIIPSV